MPPSELGAAQNPIRWRFTWEAQAHIPALRLFLFCPNTRPSIQCVGLKVNFVVERSLLAVSWSEDEVETSLGVPIPRVLVDVESPIHFRALDYYIEVKLVLLLSVDHPIISSFDAILNSSEDGSCPQNALSVELQTLSMGSDYKSLSAQEGVHFYCRSCSTKLTKSLRIFEEMPSVNWREVADNWFGACCCSFGGASERLVTKYVKSYRCSAGVGLLDTTSVVVCSDDLVGCKFPDRQRSQKCDSGLKCSGDNILSKKILDNGNKQRSSILCNNWDKMSQEFDRKLSHVFPREVKLAAKVESKVIEEVSYGNSLSCKFPASKIPEILPSTHGCFDEKKNHIWNCYNECCHLDASGPSLEPQALGTTELLTNHSTFLNGFLGNVFMARSSCLSKNVQWIEFLCPHCSCPLGAYPCGNDHTPLDSGVRLFKCYISCLPAGGSTDLFRKYTLERMLTNQLLESATDELSFRTVIRDLQTRSPMLQIILLNPNSWCSTGHCLHTIETAPKIDMYPTIKVLFSDCRNSTEFQLRKIDEWVTKNQAEEVFVLASQINELRETLELASDILPQTDTFLEGFSLSSMRR